MFAIALCLINAHSKRLSREIQVFICCTEVYGDNLSAQVNGGELFSLGFVNLFRLFLYSTELLVCVRYPNFLWAKQRIVPFAMRNMQHTVHKL